MRTNIKDPERILLLQVGAGGGGGPPAPASVALTYSSASVIVTSDRHHGPQAARYFVFATSFAKALILPTDGILPPPLRSCHIICETPSKINITPQCVQNIQCYKKRNFRMGIYSVMALKITWLYAG